MSHAGRATSLRAAGKAQRGSASEFATSPMPASSTSRLASASAVLTGAPVTVEADTATASSDCRVARVVGEQEARNARHHVIARHMSRRWLCRFHGGFLQYASQKSSLGSIWEVCNWLEEFLRQQA